MPFVYRGDNIDKVTDKDGNALFKLVLLLDSMDVKYTSNQNKKTLVSHIVFFLRSYEGNAVLVNKKDGRVLFRPKLDRIVEGMTLNDCVLFLARDLVCRLYNTDRNDREKMQQLAFCTFPIPFGLYYDKDLESTGAVIQMCINAKRLEGLNEDYEFIPFDDTELPEFISNNFDDVTFKKVGE